MISAYVVSSRVIPFCSFVPLGIPPHPFPWGLDPVPPSTWAERVDESLVTTLNATYFMISDEWACVPYRHSRVFDSYRVSVHRWMKDVSIMRVAGDQYTLSNSGFEFIDFS